eukprot:GHVO01063295.1.p2 GENE.GHVO01063295.1~~GHVO01063295.1.p2  ORF type:complete len:137 (+),score=23.23 GHVO01063295.1:214-624(+)
MSLSIKDSPQLNYHWLCCRECPRPSQSSNSPFSLVSAPKPFGGNTQFSLTFYHGGCATFLRLFYRLVKEALADNSWKPANDFTTQLQMGQNAAFVDPNDPSRVYVSQPVPLQGAPQYFEPPPMYTPPHESPPEYRP